MASSGKSNFVRNITTCANEDARKPLSFPAENHIGRSARNAFVPFHSRAVYHTLSVCGKRSETHPRNSEKPGRGEIKNIAVKKGEI